MIKEYFDQCAPTEKTSIYDKLNHYSMKNSVPLNVNLEIALSCNFSCHHCYNFDRSSSAPEEMVKDPLTFEETKKLITDLSKMGTFNLTFTGGEPLLNPKLFDYIQLTKDLHMVPRIKSNGALITKQIAKRIKESGVENVDISLYGATAKTHEDFTRTTNTFENTIKGIKALKEAGVVTSVNFIIHKGNYKEYPQMLNIVNELDIKHGTAIDISARNDKTTDSMNHRLNKEELKELFSFPDSEGFLEERPFDNLQCGCARINCGINYTGNVYPCLGAPIYCGNIREHSFSYIWKNSEQLNWIRNLGNEDYKDCLGCDMRSVCPRNSGVSYSNSGDYTAKDDWSCMTAEVITEFRKTPH